MERASIESAIKLIIAEIHAAGMKRHQLPRPPRPVLRWASLLNTHLQGFAESTLFQV